jgi:Arc/MetJ-type ribon-helix-helix transcriptional regulator
MKKQDSRTALRLPSEQRQKIDQLIQERKFKNLSQAIREAITLFLSNEGQALQDFLSKQGEPPA